MQNTPTPMDDAPRCWSHHYMTGWLCQRDAGHDGPHAAHAGVHGEPWTIDGKHRVYAWMQEPGTTACSQRSATDADWLTESE